MSIPVVCPNGHRLSVKASFSGKIGLCPTCKARVQVPKLPDDALSEDAIMGLLGPQSAAARPKQDWDDDSLASDMVKPWAARRAQPTKSCHNCHSQISAAIHICPHCHTYIAELGDF